MKHERDPRELARMLKQRIVRPEDVPGPDSPEAQKVLRTIKARRLRRARIRKFAPVLAMFLVAAGAIYVASLSQPHAIVCFEAPDLEASRHAPSSSDGSGVEACHN